MNIANLFSDIPSFEGSVSALTPGFLESLKRPVFQLDSMTPPDPTASMVMDMIASRNAFYTAATITTIVAGLGANIPNSNIATIFNVVSVIGAGYTALMSKTLYDRIALFRAAREKQLPDLI